MVLFNYATKEITAKIVYYGPGLCGKTTNLQFVYDSLPSNNKSKMLSLATKTDRTLFFDFLPLDLGHDLAGRDLVPFLLQPLHEGALGHRVRELRHGNFSGHARLQ